MADRSKQAPKTVEAKGTWIASDVARCKRPDMPLERQLKNPPPGRSRCAASD